jgi:hypothetical protein
LITGATFSVTKGASITFSGNVAGNGTLQTTGGGAITFANSAVVSVPLSVTGGVVNIGAGTGGGAHGFSIPSINIANFGTMKLINSIDQTNRTVLVTNQLSLAGSSNAWQGQLDLGANDLIIHNGSLATIFNELQSGFNQMANGYWNGPGISSSTAAADPTHGTALGFIPAGSLTSFDGQSVSPTDVIVKYTYFGDADLNGRVDANDFSLIDNGYNHPGLTGWWNGDFNYDGMVDGSDYSLIDNAFNVQIPETGTVAISQLSQATSEIAVVPESSSLAFICLGLSAFVTSRRQRRTSHQ